MKTNYFKRNFISIMVLGLLLTAGPISAVPNAKSFVGDWSGAVFIGEAEIEIVCHFKLDDSGELSGTVDSPSQGAYDLALAEIKVDGKNISFGIDDPNVTGEPLFKGTLDDAGAVISGEFSQGGGTGTFELKKD